MRRGFEEHARRVTTLNNQMTTDEPGREVKGLPVVDYVKVA